MNNLDFFKTHSPFSDPGQYRELLKILPDDIEEIVKIIPNLIVHSNDAHGHYGNKFTDQQKLESNTRYISKILARIVKLDNRELKEPRNIEKKFIGLCRDFALLFCSTLREKGIPARVRVGFATYFRKGYFIDHWICEYWNENEKRWCMVDSEIDYIIREKYQISRSLDELDLNEDQFVPSWKAWQMMREGKYDPDKAGVPRIGVTGDWFVRASLLRDFCALNKVELLPWDYTKFSKKPKIKVSNLPKSELEELDNLAEVVKNANSDFKKVRSLYRSTPHFQAKGEISSFTPLGEKKLHI